MPLCCRTKSTTTPGQVLFVTGSNHTHIGTLITDLNASYLDTRSSGLKQGVRTAARLSAAPNSLTLVSVPAAHEAQFHKLNSSGALHHAHFEGDHLLMKGQRYDAAAASAAVANALQLKGTNLPLTGTNSEEEEKGDNPTVTPAVPFTPATCPSTTLPSNGVLYCSTGLSEKASRFTTTCKCGAGSGTCAVNGKCVSLDAHHSYAGLDYSSEMAQELVELCSLVYNVNSTDQLQAALESKTTKQDGETTGTYVWKNNYAAAKSRFVALVSDTLDTQFFYTQCDEKKYSVICYRGSETNFNWNPFGENSSASRDWAADLDKTLASFPTLCPVGKLHRGFSNQMVTPDADKNTTISEIDKMVAAIPEGYMLYVTGHSLGGALSQVTSSYLANRHPSILPRLRTIIFAGPRVADATAAAWINQRVPNLFNVAEDGDVVAVQPALSFGYAQLGHFLTRFPNAQWGVDLAPDSGAYTGSGSGLAAKNHKLGDPTPVPCNANYRCDVPSMPTKLSDFYNTGGDKQVGTCRWGACNDPNTDCTDSKCLCKKGYFATNGGSQCAPYPEGFVPKALGA